MALTTAAPPTTAQASEASNSTGSLPLPILAGAAGGGLVLIIVVVVIVVRSRRGPSKPRVKKEATQRKVVAFENPMYDTPKVPASSEGVYDNNASDGLYDNNGDNAGLYDEPAFAAKSDKDNPLYESTENLHAQQPEIQGQLYDDPQTAMTDGSEGFGFNATDEPDLNDAGYLDVTNND